MFASRTHLCILLTTLSAVPVVSLAQSPSPPVYTVAVDSFSFAPQPIHLKAGQPVTLNFVNRSGSGHDFTAKSFFSHARILSGTTDDGEVELGGHQTRSITLVPMRGSYHAHCGHFLHKQMGMSVDIIVD